MKKISSTILLYIFVSLFTFASNSVLDRMSGFPSWAKEAVLNGETVEFYSVYDDYVPSIAFDNTKGKEKAILDSSKDNALVSGIATFVPYPEKWNSLTFEEKKLEIINTLLSISTIKGITYISYSAGEKPKVLFSDAYTLTSEKKGKKAYDVEFEYAPEKYEYEIAAYLKDNIFGGNNYKIKYDIKGNEIFMTITNLSKLKFLFYTAVKEEELNLCVDVLMTDEGIAIFGMATIMDAEEYIETPITDVHLPSAFTRRITSLKDWFIKEINS